MLSPLSSLSRVMKIGVTSETLSQVELTTLAKWTIRPRLMAIPGVANVAIWGQRDRQLQVLVDPDRLRAHGVTLDEVVQPRARRRLAASRRVPRYAESTAARVTHAVSACRHAQRSRIDQSSSHAATATALARSATSPTVVEGFPPPIGDAVINDGPGLLLIVEKQLGANTLQVTRDVEDGAARR